MSQTPVPNSQSDADLSTLEKNGRFHADADASPHDPAANGEATPGNPEDMMRDHLTGQAGDDGASLEFIPDDGEAAGAGEQADEALTPPAVTLPDRAKQQRDVRADLKRSAAGDPTSQLLDHIVDHAFASQATDIHMDPMDGRYRIRYRIDGVLHEVLQTSPSSAAAVVSRIKVVAKLRLLDRRRPQDGQWVVTHGGRPRTLRVSTIPTDFGERVVLRLHEALNMALGLDQLGLLPEQVETLRKLCARAYGAVLVGGPVGAGKTTTLYSCMRHVNHPTRNLMTIEDPIEFRIPGVNQVGVDSAAGFTIPDGLRAVLRQDPNVLMIGEMRDHETALIGVRAALTGVLVFSTLHASDAASAISALFSFGIPGYILSNAVNGIISQRLLRRICPYCTEAFTADAAALSFLGLSAKEHDGLVLHRGKGCSACFETGYLGRTGIFEVMEVDSLLHEMILAQTTREVLYQIARDQGMKTLRECAVQKVLDGEITIDEIVRMSL